MSIYNIFTTNTTNSTEKEIIVYDSNGLEHKIQTKYEPFLKMKDNFFVFMTIENIFSTIDKFLYTNYESSYKFVPEDCSWELILNTGYTRSKIVLYVYKTPIENKYIIEMNELTRGYEIKKNYYNNLFQDINKLFLVDELFTKKEDNTMKELITMNDYDEYDINESDINETIKMAIELSKTNFLDEITSAIKILYDMSLNTKIDQRRFGSAPTKGEEPNFVGNSLEESNTPGRFGFFNGIKTHLLQSIYITEIIELVDNVLNEKPQIFENTKHCAIMFLGNLSDSIITQESMLSSPNLIKTLISYIGNGDYTNIYLRRECGRIVKDISSTKSSILKEKMTKEEWETWFSTIPLIHDSQILKNSQEIQKNLQNNLLNL